MPGAGDQRTPTPPSGGSLGAVDPTAGFTLHSESVVDTERQSLLNEQSLNARRDADAGETGIKLPPRQTEVERYVERVLGRKLPRFGSNLLLPSQRRLLGSIRPKSSSAR